MTAMDLSACLKVVVKEEGAVGGLHSRSFGFVLERIIGVVQLEVGVSNKVLCNQPVRCYFHLTHSPNSPHPLQKVLSAPKTRCNTQSGFNWTPSGSWGGECKHSKSTLHFADMNVVDDLEVSGVRCGHLRPAQKRAARPAQQQSLQCKLNRQKSCATCWLPLTNMSGH